MAESEHERIDRELIELLNELRVALPGVQILFAFLLMVPFTERFGVLDRADRWVYFADVVASALACCFLIAPSAHHRVRFRDDAKAEMVRAANRLATIGLMLLAVGLSTSLYLVTHVVFRSTLAALVAGAFTLFTLGLWFALPLSFAADRRETAGSGAYEAGDRG